MPPEILKTDRETFHDFNTVTTLEGTYTGTTETGHRILKADLTAEIVDKNPEYKTVNEAIEMIKSGDKIKIEFLGYSETEKRGLFEVSKME